MRIGVDAELLLRDRYTGIEVYIAELVTRMPRLGRGHEFRLYFHYLRSRRRAIVDQYARDGVQARVCRIPWQILWPLHWRLGVPVDWFTGRVDVMFYPCFLTFPQRWGRTVVTVHDLLPLTHPAFYPPEYAHFFQAHVSSSVARADAVIAVLNNTGSQVQERLGVPADGITCIPHGIHERFRPPEDPEAAAAVAARYGIRGSYLLNVGTMEPRKNVVRLVEAFGRAAAHGPVRDHTLVLAGKPAWDEAAACGRPVVATRSGGAEEIVVDGQMGLLVPVGDAAAMAEAVTTLLTDPAWAASMGQAGRRRAEAHFDLIRMVRQVEAEYRTVLAEQLGGLTTGSLGATTSVIS